MRFRKILATKAMHYCFLIRNFDQPCKREQELPVCSKPPTEGRTENGTIRFNAGRQGNYSPIGRGLKLTI